VQGAMTLLACAVAGVLALPACGESQSPEQERASQPLPPEKVDDIDRRVTEIEKELERLRQELEGRADQSAGGQGDGAATGADDGSSASGGGRVRAQAADPGRPRVQEVAAPGRLEPPGRRRGGTRPRLRGGRSRLVRELRP
jgi:hypothetical protein